jgi:hypothetical protein
MVPVVVPEGCALPTIKDTVAVWLRLPLAPVMVNVKLPEAVELIVDTVRVDDPDPLTEDGLKLPVAPLGSPLMLNDTVPLNPFKADAEIVKLAPLPATTDCDAGVAESEKSGEAVLTSCQSAGTLGGSQPTSDVWAWIHLYSCPLNVTSAPTAYAVLGAHAGTDCATVAKGIRQTIIRIQENAGDNLRFMRGASWQSSGSRTQKLVAGPSGRQKLGASRKKKTHKYSKLTKTIQ